MEKVKCRIAKIIFSENFALATLMVEEIELYLVTQQKNQCSNSIGAVSATILKPQTTDY